MVTSGRLIDYRQEKNKNPPQRGIICLFGSLFAGFGQFLVEFGDAAILLDEALLAGIERVAVAAGIDFDFLQSGSGFEGGSARSAGDGALLVGRVDIFFHFFTPFALRQSIAKRVTALFYVFYLHLQAHSANNP